MKELFLVAGIIKIVIILIKNDWIKN